MSDGTPFKWGLTPGDDPADVPPVQPPQAEPAVPPPAEPAVLPPVEPAPFDPFATVAMPAVPPPAPAVEPGPPVETAPFDPFATVAMPVVGQELETVPQSQWFGTPVDSSLEGVNEVIEAEIVGLPTPEGEGVEASALDSLFGDTQFRDYDGEPLIPSAAVVRVTSGPKPPKGPAAPIPKVQKVLMWVAGSLAAALALVALFLLGTRLTPAPAVIAEPSPTPTPSFIVLPLGPVDPGEYQWDELLGGECLDPWVSAWQDRYTVVDCTTPHPAQMVYRGTFDDESFAAYPGLEELQKRINLLCTPPTIINYAAAGAAKDVQVEASFAVDATDWDDGNRTYFCFVTRSTGENFTTSVAVPQVAPTPTPAATP